MRILGMVLVFISCSGIGLNFSFMNKKRVGELCEWNRGLNLLKNEINFSRTPLSEAFEIVGSRLIGELSLFFENIAMILKSNRNVPMERLDDDLLLQPLNETCLRENDKAKIVSFIKNIGLLDKDSQINQMEMQIQNLKQEIDTAKKDEEKNNKLFKTLGILAGIFIIVLFI